MSVELIFLTMLIVGIVLVGIGLMRRAREYGRRGLDYAGDAATVVYGWGRNKVRSYARSLGRDVVESGKAFGASVRAYHHLQELDEMEKRGAVTGEEAERLRQELTTVYQRGTRGLQVGLGTLYHGGSEGKGIFGERGEGTLYGESKSLLGRVGFPSLYLKVAENISKWVRSRIRREE